MDEELARLLRDLRGRSFGKYRGFVVDNVDPEKLARLRLRVPSLLADQVTDWALPCLPFGGLANQGLFLVPEVGAQVWVEFEGGDRSHPVWTGTFWQASGDVPTDKDEPTTRVLRTPKGHVLSFEDADDEEAVHIEHCTGATVDIDPQGTIALTDANGAALTLDAENNRVVVADANGNTLTLDSGGVSVEDASGNKIQTSASGIKVEGQQIVVEGTQVMLGGQGGEPVIKGQSFLTLFATHVHTSVPTGGPTSPPIPQGEMSALSMKVTTA
jgi:hypothetical protein